MHNFADDNTLSVSDISVEQIIHHLEHGIDILQTWFIHNGILLNEIKCQFLTVESSKSKRNAIASVKGHGKHIVECTDGKLLGITFDSNLTMKKHIAEICKQAGNKLNALARVSKFLDQDKRILLMKSFVISQFNYCPIIWMYCQRQSDNLINKIHERTLRIAYKDYTSDFKALLEKDCSVKLHQGNIQTLASEIFKTKHDLNSNFMKNIFCPVGHGYYTRKQNLNYPNSKTVFYGLDTHGYRANEIWNNLPEEIQSAEDLKTFKILLSANNSNLCSCNLCKSYLPNVTILDNFLLPAIIHIYE